MLHVLIVCNLTGGTIKGILKKLWSNIPVNILILDVLVPVYSAYKNLVISSVGVSRFNRLGSSFSSRTGMSSLGCVINFSRYLVLWLFISAWTVGICRSVCITVFGTCMYMKGRAE